MTKHLFLSLALGVSTVFTASVHGQNCQPATGLIISSGTGGSWASNSTWTRISGPSNRTPTAGDHVIISSGSPVILDVANLALAHLEIHDDLSVSDTQAYTVDVSRVDVGGPVSFPFGQPRTPGTLTVGTSAAPFQNQFTLRLTDDFLKCSYVPMAESDENMSFIVHGGSSLELHGRDLDSAGVARQPWVQLANLNIARPNDTSMLLEMDAGWESGDRLVIASTDYDMLEAEELTVQSTAGALTNFLPALAHHHHGIIEQGLVDERAEVGLLSHNIVITSEVVRATGPNSAGLGNLCMPSVREDIRAGHLMAHNRNGSDPQPQVSIQFTEFREMGWKGALGRYPIHFHLLGDTAGILVRNCSVHHCFNRSVTIHGTNGVRVEGVVAYDTIGHSFYLEDRSEVKNELIGNLGLITRLPTLPVDDTVHCISQIWSTTGKPYFCLHDLQVSTYWITNTRNTINGNHAAGSELHGFWYDCGDEYLGFIQWVLSLAPILLHCDFGAGFLAQEPVIFNDNTAHSNGAYGFWNDPTRLMPADSSLQIPLNTENRFVDFTAYKNRDAGIWHRGYGTHRWIRARVADNRLGIYLASEGFQTDGMVFEAGEPDPVTTTPFDNPIVGFPTMSLQTVEDSVIIGETTNEPESLPVPEDPYAERKGIVFYDGMVLVTNTDFIDFVTVPIGNFFPPPLVAPAPPAMTPNLTHRVAMGITSFGRHTSNNGNPWNVDPRNAILGCTFTNCTHPVLFPIPHYGTTTQPNGVMATSVLDLDGSVPGSFPGAYIANNTPALRVALSPAPVPLPFGHYAAPLIYGGPGTADDQALAQITVTIPDGPDYFTLSSINRSESYVVRRPPMEEQFPTNVLLTKPGTPEEEYAVSFTNGDFFPKFTLRMQFSVKDRPAVFRFPYPGDHVPTVTASTDLFPGHAIWPMAATLADFQLGNGDWFLDTTDGELWLRSVLFDGTPLGIGIAPAHPVGSGRSLTLEVE